MKKRCTKLKPNETNMRYDFDPSKVTTGFTVFDKGQYETVLFEPSTFHFDGANGKADRDGIKFPAQIAEGEHKGKMVTFMPDFNNDFGPAQAKALVMASLGYDPASDEDEKQFNDDHGDDDFGLDTEVGFIGDGWTQIKGQRVLMNLDINMAKDGSGKKFQKFSSFKPV